MYFEQSIVDNIM